MDVFKIKTRPLDQQVIVITGASSGIGLATAKMAAKLGAKVVASSRNGEDLKRLVREIANAGGEAISVVADVSKESDLERLRDRAIAKFGRIDTWVNNAAVSIYGKLMDLSFEEEKRLFEVNFWGVRHGSRIAVETLAENGGVLINVGSEVSMRSIPLQGIYSASKHAVKAYTDALRMEIEKDEVPVAISLVRPTAIATPYPEHAVNRLEKGTPSLPDPMYHPDAVAAAIVDCAVHPKRDVFVGGPAKVMAVLEALAPRFLDKVAEKMYFKKQMQGDPALHREANEGLHHAPAREGEILGADAKKPGKLKKVKDESLYTLAARKGRKPAESSDLRS